MLTDEDKQWILDQLERVETSLLTEFHKWASPVEMRVRSHAAAIRAIDVEVESLGDRMKKIEDGPSSRPLLPVAPFYISSVKSSRPRPNRPAMG
jgi:hypothetical protein